MSYDSDNHIPYILGLSEEIAKADRSEQAVKVQPFRQISPRLPYVYESESGGVIQMPERRIIRRSWARTAGSTPGSDMAVERPEADTKVTRIRHSTLKHFICILTKHTWTNDTTYPGSYCKRCGQQA